MENSFYYKGLFMIYDLLDITYFHNYSQSPRKAVLDLIESKDIKLLDICTGTATNAINIAAQNKTVQITGIDLSKEMLRTAKKKIRKKGLTNIKLYKMDAADTKFKAQTFDVIIISLILHELPKETAEKLLLEAKRILKPDGKILVVEWEAPKKCLQKVLFYPIKKLEPKGFEQFLSADLTEYFRKFGFEVKKLKHCDFSKVYYLN